MIDNMYEHIMEHIRSMPSPELVMPMSDSHKRTWDVAVEAFRRQILGWDYRTEPFSERKSK